MILSYEWLKKYHPETIPSADDVADLLTMHFAEIEGVDAAGNDTALTLKVTPDRGCYGLCHAGVAYEIAALAGRGKTKSGDQYLRSAFAISRADIADVPKKELVQVGYDGCKVCHVAEVTLGKADEGHPLLKEIRSFLSTVGQRSISPLVDIINFVTLDIGQPLHAFDADKVLGTLVVRAAANGEEMTTLDGVELKLSGEDAVTADAQAVLDLAGVKGGKAAETTSETKRIYLKAALYERAGVRRSSIRHGLRTDAAKRFEQGIDAERPLMGLRYVLSLVEKIYAGSTVDGYQGYVAPGQQEKANEILLKADDVRSYIGNDVSDDEIVTMLKLLGCEVEEGNSGLIVRIPDFRLDLRIDRDLIEEVARLSGLQAITPKQLPTVSGDKQKISHDQLFVVADIVRSALVANGAIELITYSLHETGDLEILNPVSPERSHARTSIALKLEHALRVYGPEAVTVGYDDVTVFEIGSVFGAESGERIHLCIGARAYKYKDKFVKTLLDEARLAVEKVFAGLGLTIKVDDISVAETIRDGVGLLELDLTTLAEHLSGIAVAHTFSESKKTIPEFVPPSPFPSVVRDIAFFAPADVSEEVLVDLITSTASELLMNLWVFDRFTKPGEETTSFGFRLVFQSPERTLTDAEVQNSIDSVTAMLAAKGYTPRV